MRSLEETAKEKATWRKGQAQLPPGGLPLPPMAAPPLNGPQPGIPAPAPTTGTNPVKIVFSVLRVSSTDMRERVLVSQLNALKKSPADAKGPVVFPVFGRGRVLDGIAGTNITTGGLSSAAIFLCGNCSCEVKSQNPGTDLIIAANWEAADGKIIGPLQELPSLAAVVPTQHEAAPAPASTNTPQRSQHETAQLPMETEDGVLKRHLVVLTCAFLAIVAFVSVIVSRRPSSTGGGR